MTQKELIALIAARTNSTQVAAARHLEATIEILGTVLVDRDSVTLRGLGTFATKERAGRKGVNPATSEAIEIPARTAATFRPASRIKRILAESSVAGS